MNNIVRPVTADGKTGYDSMGQFWITTEDYPGSFASRPGRDLRASTCLLCTRGWDSTAESLLDQFALDSYGGYVHRTCYERHLGFIERLAWIGALEAAGWHKDIASFRDIRNQYGGGWNTPWYEVQTKCTIPHMLIVGTRKRVKSIKINMLAVPQAEKLKEAFAGEDVTKDVIGSTFTIHAWSDEKAVEYLTIIRGVVIAN